MSISFYTPINNPYCRASVAALFVSLITAACDNVSSEHVIEAEQGSVAQAVSAPELGGENPVTIAVLPDGLETYAKPESRYAAVALAASVAYKGQTELATLNQDHSGEFLAAVLHGPISTATIPGNLPLGTGNRDTQGALFPGWPVSILSRVGVGTQEHSMSARSYGTSLAEGVLEKQRSESYQQAWWELFSSDGGQQNCSGGGVVTWSSNLLANTQLSGDERSITWENCQVLGTAIPGLGEVKPPSTEGITLSGSIRIHRDTDEKGQELYQIAWDGLQYSGNGARWQLLGVTTSYGANGCNFDNRRLVHLLVQPLDQGSPMLLQNFRVGIVGDYLQPSLCKASGPFQNVFDGQIFHAKHGRVDVTTPAHLSFTSLSPTINQQVNVLAKDPLDSSKESDGVLLLTGHSDSKVEFSLSLATEYGGVYDQEYKGVSDTAVYSIEFSTGERAPFSTVIDRRLAMYGILADLSDRDSDEIPGGWELLYEYDPLNSSDAGEDRDNDGKNTYNEFVDLTDPTKGYDYLAAGETDASLSMSWSQLEPADSAYYKYDGQQNSNVDYVGSISVSGDESGPLSRLIWRVSLQIEGPAYFPDPYSYSSYSAQLLRFTHCEYGAAGDSELQCEWDEYRYCDWNGCEPNGHVFQQLAYAVTGPGTVKVTAQLESASADPDSSNDHVEIVFESP